MKQKFKITNLHVAIIIIVVAICAVYISLTIQIRDSEERSFEAIHRLQVEIDQLKLQD